MDAVDADVVIYAASQDHPFAARIGAVLVPSDGGDPPVGSVLLLPEVLSKPLRQGRDEETQRLVWFLARVDLRAVDRPTVDLAVALAARYALRAADAVHLATAVAAGADRFVTNNRKDFRPVITEIDVTYPDDLEEPR